VVDEGNRRVDFFRHNLDDVLVIAEVNGSIPEERRAKDEADRIVVIDFSKGYRALVVTCLNQIDLWVDIEIEGLCLVNRARNVELQSESGHIGDIVLAVGINVAVVILVVGACEVAREAVDRELSPHIDEKRYWHGNVGDAVLQDSNVAVIFLFRCEGVVIPGPAFDLEGPVLTSLVRLQDGDHNPVIVILSILLRQ